EQFGGDQKLGRLRSSTCLRRLQLGQSAAGDGDGVCRPPDVAQTRTNGSRRGTPGNSPPAVSLSALWSPGAGKRGLRRVDWAGLWVPVLVRCAPETRRHAARGHVQTWSTTGKSSRTVQSLSGGNESHLGR